MATRLLRAPASRRQQLAFSDCVDDRVICFSLEQIAAVGYAIMTTRSPDISWQDRAARVLPMFLVPALAALIYSAITSLTKWREYNFGASLFFLCVVCHLLQM